MLNRNKIIEITKKYYPSCQAIYLFGSYASGNNKKISDIDIAILLDPIVAKKIDSFLLTDFHQDLENYFNKNVDLVNIRNANSTLQMQIIFNSEIIYNNNNLEKENFEMTAISLYQKLNEERKETLKQYA
jgi:uncharacterized protein